MIFEMNPVAEGLRFPTQAQVEAILEDTNTTRDGTADVSQYKLASRYFPSKNIRATELEMYAIKNPYDYGMTYFHTLNTEPRTVQRPEGIELHKTSWRGAHFKEGAHWGEGEILELASLAPKLRPLKITDDVANALAGMRLRRERRINWLAAQVLTTGSIQVSKTDADNPEKVSYSVNYQLRDDAEIVLADKFDDKDGGGVSLVNPVKFFKGLIDEAKRSGRPYRPTEVLTTSDFVRVIRENTLFWDTWAQYNTIETESTRERRPAWMYEDDFVLRALRTMTGLTFTLDDSGYFKKDGSFKQFIPNGHMTIIYSGPGKFGEFTFTAHAHSQNGRLRIGTGPYSLVDNGLDKPNPYYQIFHGFHGLPRLLDYDVRTLKCERLRFCTYASSPAAVE